MQKQIAIGNETLIYTLKKSKKARNVRLSVSHDGTVVVSMPFFVREKVAERFVKEKSKWLLKKLALFKQREGQKTTRYGKDDYRKYKEVARKLATERVEYFNETYKCKYNRISIRNQKTMWGSCSSKGNLNFNYKIVHLPLRTADYIIVHELCHLKEMNHSKKFWDLVSIFFPNYKEIRKDLRKLGISLN
ncbi:M48 family metallopeptidase [Patescibacteria group bacterium]|nr:M48 family metallopeptidase [Patescibacteria group bacterium]